MRDLSDVVLVCPRNDAESALIHLIAALVKIKTITSCQGPGARLEAELILTQLAEAGPEKEIWIVELPGPEIEQRLESDGFKVVVIDHHTYGPLDRSHTPDGKRLPSSLEQFLALAEIDDGAMINLGLDPKPVRGIGIFDDRYAQGLRDEGYTSDEIRHVLAFRNGLLCQMNAAFDGTRTDACRAWDAREMRDGLTIVRATGEAGVRGEIGIITIEEDCDTKPLIVIESDGRAVFVQNMEPYDVGRLRIAFDDKGYNTFTFGAGRCWGTDNKKGTVKAVPLAEIFSVLGI